MITPSRTVPATASASAVLIAALLLIGLLAAGPLSAHMGLHILLMNVAAPLLAAFLSQRLPAGKGWVRAAWLAALGQMLLLWVWHVPGLQKEVMHSPALQFAMHGSLLAAALGFWLALLQLPAASRWQAIPALLLSGKLACLLAVLLIFAPRLLFDAPAQGHRVTLEDQQLAGLLMVIACPLSYVVAGIVFAAQMLRDLEQRTPEAERPPRSLTG